MLSSGGVKTPSEQVRLYNISLAFLPFFSPLLIFSQLYLSFFIF